MRFISVAIFWGALFLPLLDATDIAKKSHDELDYRVVAEDLKERRTYSISLDATTPDGSTFGGITSITYDKDRDYYYALTDNIEEFRRQLLSWGSPATESASETKSNAESRNNEAKKSDLRGKNQINIRNQTQSDLLDKFAGRISIPSFNNPDDRNSQERQAWPAANTINAIEENWLPNNTKQGNQLPVGEFHPRFYTLILGKYDATIVSVTRLTDENGVPYSHGDLVPNAIAYNQNVLYIAHDGEKVHAGLGEYELNGQKKTSIPFPSYFRFQNSDSGFNSLSVDRGGKSLWAAAKTSLKDDDDDYVRLVMYDLYSNTPMQQYTYETDKKLLDFIAIDENGSFLSLESDGRLYYVHTHVAMDVNDIHSIDRKAPNTVKKTYLRKVNIDNISSMAIDFKDNSAIRIARHQYHDYHDEDSSSEDDSDKYNLFLINNNHFNHKTKIFNGRLHVDISIDVVGPEVETAEVRGDGFATDPAIWIHPNFPEDSYILGALNDGGLAIYNLKGRREHTVDRSAYANVDVIYAFKYDDGELADIVVATRGKKEKIEIFEISTRELKEVTSKTLYTDGPCYDVAGYVSPFTGEVFVFIAGKSKVTQVRLFDDGHGKIDGDFKNSRTIDVDQSISGLVVDRELGYLYVAVKDRERIYRYDAEPNEEDGDDYKRVLDDRDGLEGTIRGMTIYYNGYNDGYLIVSLSKESTFAVYERSKNHDYIGKFTLGNRDGNHDIDKTDATRGIDVININLGPDFECGLFIAQDSNNDADEIGHANTNFKLVPFDDIADTMSDHLKIDTETYGPRRFNLAIWADKLSQEVYTAMYDEFISGRDAEMLLAYLAQTSFHLYPPASQLRQIMEPYYYDSGNNDDNDHDSDRDRSKKIHRNLWETPVAEPNAGLKIARMHASKKKCTSSRLHKKSPMRDDENDKAYTAINRFIDLLRKLRRDEDRLDDLPSNTYDYLMELSRQIEDSIPGQYGKSSSSSSSYDDDDRRNDDDHHHDDDRRSDEDDDDSSNDDDDRRSDEDDDDSSNDDDDRRSDEDDDDSSNDDDERRNDDDDSGSDDDNDKNSHDYDSSDSNDDLHNYYYGSNDDDSGSDDKYDSGSDDDDSSSDDK